MREGQKRGTEMAQIFQTFFFINECSFDIVVGYELSPSTIFLSYIMSYDVGTGWELGSTVA